MVATYHRYETTTGALVIGHHSDICAVAISRKKWSDVPHAAPNSTYTVVADAAVPARQCQAWPATVASASAATIQSAWVYGLGVPAVSAHEPNSSGR